MPRNARTLGSGLCSNPVIDIASSTGAYSFTLDPGSYNIAGFYELKGGGPRFIGIVVDGLRDVGELGHRQPARALPVPAKLTGTETVTRVPKSDPVKLVKPLVCPANEPFTGGTPASDCVSTGRKAKSTTSKSGSITASGTYTQSGLPAG